MVNTLRPKQNGRHFADDTFKRIFLNENIRISIKMSPKFVPKGLINNIPALVLIMAWRRLGDKPLSEQCWLDHWRIYASLGLNELNIHNPTLPVRLDAICRCFVLSNPASDSQPWIGIFLLFPFKLFTNRELPGRSAQSLEGSVFWENRWILIGQIGISSLRPGVVPW